MLKIQRSITAKSDLKSIWHFIADQNPTAADTHIDRIEERISLLARMPDLGTRLATPDDDVRFFTFGSYVIYYRIANDSLRILRVLHGARQLPPSFEFE